jgi:DNA polymerase (family 10)
MMAETFLFAKAIAEATLLRVKLMEGPCEEVEIAGSLRRLRSQVHDIDLVVILKPGVILDAMQLHQALGNDWRWVKGGAKLIAGNWRGIDVDIYMADEASWWTLVLLKTGSKEHNVRLATLAKRRRWHLHADGGGMTAGDYRIAGDSEESFFTALGIPYLEPWKRDEGNW